jgi:hypothetical protein
MSIFSFFRRKKNKEINESMFEACYWGKLDLVKKCIIEGADLNHVSFYNKVNWNQEYRKKDRETGYWHQADPDYWYPSFDGWTPLIVAAYKGDDKIVSLLLNNGADINKKNKDGMTALMVASRAKNPSVVKILLEYGANQHIKNRNGETALDLAQKYYNYSIINELEKAKNEDIIKSNTSNSASIKESDLSSSAISRESLIQSKPSSGFFLIIAFVLRKGEKPNDSEAKEAVALDPAWQAALAGKVQIHPVGGWDGKTLASFEVFDMLERMHPKLVPGIRNQSVFYDTILINSERLLISVYGDEFWKDVVSIGEA